MMNIIIVSMGITIVGLVVALREAKRECRRRERLYSIYSAIDDNKDNLLLEARNKKNEEMLATQERIIKKQESI